MKRIITWIAALCAPIVALAGAISHIKDVVDAPESLKELSDLWWIQAIASSNTTIALAALSAAWLLYILASEGWVPFLAKYTPVRAKPRSSSSDDKYWSLNWAVFYLIDRSAWSRYQKTFSRLKNKTEAPESFLISMALQNLSSRARNEDLTIRGRLPGQIEYQDIKPDLWRLAALHAEEDKASLWKVFIIPAAGIDPAIIPKYEGGLIVEREQIQRFWPEQDSDIEANMRRLIRQAKLKLFKERLLQAGQWLWSRLCGRLSKEQATKGKTLPAIRMNDSLYLGHVFVNLDSLKKGSINITLKCFTARRLVFGQVDGNITLYTNNIGRRAMDKPVLNIAKRELHREFYIEFEQSVSQELVDSIVDAFDQGRQVDLLLERLHITMNAGEQDGETVIARLPLWDGVAIYKKGEIYTTGQIVMASATAPIKA